MATVDTKTVDILSKISQGLRILIPKKGIDSLTYDPIGFRERDLTLFLVFFDLI